MSNYAHPKWRKKRAEVLSLRNYQCEDCGKKNNLQVHHKTYVFNKPLWEYENSDLLVLCLSCHRKQHGFSGELKVCEYAGCEHEIEKIYKYCFKHREVVMTEQRAKAKAQLESAEVISEQARKEAQHTLDHARKEARKLLEEAKNEGRSLKKRIEDEDVGSEKYEKLERQLADLNSQLAEKEEKKASASLVQDVSAPQKTSNSTPIIVTVIAVIAIGLIVLAKSADRNAGANSGSGKGGSVSQQGGQSKGLPAEAYSSRVRCSAPSCSGHIMLKKGSRGLFYSCTEFPSCRETRDYPLKCQKCGRAVALRVRRKDGNQFIGCSSYPKCKHTEEYRDKK